MDRPILHPQPKRFYFDALDIFPYSIALLMFAGEMYILHQFVVLTGMLHH